MRTALTTLLLVISLSGTAAAQGHGLRDGQTRANRIAVSRGAFSQLTREDQKLLMRGEYSSGEIAGGAFLGLVVGFGAGQAAQGRWLETGWLYTLGHITTTAMWMYGVNNIDLWGGNDDGVALLVAGAILGPILRVSQFIDAIAVPAARNRRVRALHVQLGVAPVLSPTDAAQPNLTGATGSVTLRF